MKKALGLGSVVAGVAIVAMVIAGCQKEQITTPADAVVVKGEKITLNERQKGTAQEAYARMPKVRYWDEAHHRFIEMSTDGSRDLVFTDPDEGFSFTDPDENGAMILSDAEGTTFVFSSGIGLAGNGGGGLVVAGSSSLPIDIAICLSAEAIAAGDGGSYDIFDSGLSFSNYSAVFGISGDFEGLADADTDAEDFNPFDYFHGFAMFYVISDEVSGSHDVFDWMGASDEGETEEDLDDLASAFMMDFTNFSLYFATDGTITVSSGQMTFSGEFLAITDLFDSFLDDGLGDDEPDAELVDGFGTMGCN